MKMNFWIVFAIVGLLLDVVSYRAKLNFKLKSIPLSAFDVFTEYRTNHQELYPMILGPIFIWFLAYLLTGLFIK